MRRLQNRRWNYLLLAFAFPFVGMLVLMLVCGYEPFGKSAMLYSDMYHQYYPFFAAFRRAILSGDSLLYSWDVGLGMDYLGLIAYYLASPLNLISILVPEGWLLEFFCLLMPIKLGLASLFFAIFLKRIFDKDDLSISLFGAFYGLCAWALGYQWNVMWLDTFALLPLVALGTVMLLRDRKFVLYTITLFLSVFSNYYIGFFTCIFVLLLFFCYQICRWGGVGKFFRDLGRIAVFSGLAIGMTAILELPALAALQTTQSSVNNFPDTFRLNIATEHNLKGLLDAMRQVAGNMNGGLEPNFKEGLPNVYCGVGTVMLASLFLMSGEVRFRDKVCTIFLLLLFMVSFIIRQLDYIWHGFHFTNMIPYRFSFLYSFVLLYMAYRAYLMRHTFGWVKLACAGIIGVAVFVASETMKKMVTGIRNSGVASYFQSDDGWKALLFAVFTLAFLVLYLGVLGYGRKLRDPAASEDPAVTEKILARREQNRKSAGMALSLVMATELVLNLVCFGVYFPGTAVGNYPKGTEHAASMIRYMKEREEDNLFYRAEVTHSQTLNDGAINGYHGVSTFTSSANVKVTEFMQTLGYGAKNTYNRYCYEEASPVSDLFLGLKYMIDRDGKEKESAYFEEIHRYGSVSLLENKVYLPLGFLAEPELADLKFDAGNSMFRFQNRLATAAAGTDGDVWKLMGGSNLSITGQDVTIKNETSGGYCSYGDGLSGSAVVYSYTVDMDGFFCVDLNLPKRNSVSIWKNGVELYSESISLQQMLAVGDVEVGDVVEVRATCKAGESGTMTISAAILHPERFRQTYETLRASTLELTAFSNTEVAGRVSCNRDGLLYLSIPQNGNWTAEVDGEPVEISLVGDVMIALPLTEGEHEVRLCYSNAAFVWGMRISICCALVFAVLIYIYYHPKRARGKYEKKETP